MMLRLRHRIALYYAIATGLLVATVFFILYTVVFRTVYDHMDGDLDAESLEALNSIVVLNDDIIFTNPDEWSEKEHTAVEVNPVFVQVNDTNGVLLKKTPNLRQLSLAFSPAIKTKSYFNATVARSPIRQVQIPLVNGQGRALAHLIVALPRKEADLVLSNLRLALFTLFPLVLVVVFFLSSLIAAKNVAPIERIISTAERISSQNLDERIALPKAKDELHLLATTTNQLLDRLQDALLHERQFTADASHELRTPLAVLKGTLDVLLRKPRTNEHYREKIIYCISEVDRLSTLMEKLLLLARYDSGALKPALRTFDLATSLDAVVARMEPLLFSQQCTLQYENNGEVLVNADPGMVETILENLVSNAIKYSPSGSSIDITVEGLEDGVHCGVTDRGVGIGKEHLSRIYERFYRIDESRTSQVKGAGLGLAIVKRLVDVQQLTLEIHSEPHKGTMATLIFPHRS